MSRPLTGDWEDLCDWCEKVREHHILAQPDEALDWLDLWPADEWPDELQAEVLLLQNDLCRVRSASLRLADLVSKKVAKEQLAAAEAEIQDKLIRLIQN